MIRRFPAATRVLFALSAIFSIADGPPRMLARVAAAIADRAETEPPGSDVFVTPREALLREKPSTTARTLARLTPGTRLTLVESTEAFLKVELPTPPNLPPRSGCVAREVVAIFAPGPEATDELVRVGRLFSRNDTNRRLAVALLARASERKRAGNVQDAALEVLLGETAEALAAAGEPFPPGLEIVPRRGPTEARFVYAGPAFQRALELTAQSPSGQLASVRERALAGALRVQ